MVESGAGNDAIQVLFLFSFPTGKDGGQVTPDSLPTSLATEEKRAVIFNSFGKNVLHGFPNWPGLDQMSISELITVVQDVGNYQA